MTIQEAVAWLRMQFTQEYIRECLAYWRAQYGDRFADQVKQEFERKK